jgi:translation elongation factor EF-G
MLDAVMMYLPSPLDIGAVEGKNPDYEDRVETRKPENSEPFCGLAFKIATDPFVGRLCFVRAYSGVLPAGSYVINTRSEKKERISRIFQMHSNKQNPIDELEAGDIGAVEQRRASIADLKATESEERMALSQEVQIEEKLLGGLGIRCPIRRHLPPAM